MVPLRGKLALITGGSRGIGLAIAKAFARHGASTILVGRNADSLQSAVESVQAQPVAAHLSLPSITRQYGAQGSCTSSPGIEPEQHWPPFHSGAHGDVRLVQTWDDLCDQLDQGHFAPRGVDPSPHRVDILVNCAGIAQNSILLRTPVDIIEEILDTNLKAAVLGCKYISRQMLRSRMLTTRGHERQGQHDLDERFPTNRTEKRGMSIINVSSVMATRGGQGASVYSASKAGILGLTSALSTELGPYGIRVNALAPGYIKTDMIENLNQDLLSKQIPLKRLGQVEEVADAAVFLAQNSYANNCILTIDGGLSAALKG